MLKLLMALLILVPSFSVGDTAQDDRRVNDHLHSTQTKIQILHDRTVLDNEKKAPPLERSPTYEDAAKYREYGVEMPRHLPFDDLDLDHLDDEEAASSSK